MGRRCRSCATSAARKVNAAVERTVQTFGGSRCAGDILIDDPVLYEVGERDFDKYRVEPSYDLGGGTT